MRKSRVPQNPNFMQKVFNSFCWKNYWISCAEKSGFRRTSIVFHNKITKNIKLLLDPAMPKFPSGKSTSSSTWKFHDKSYGPSLLTTIEHSASQCHRRSGEQCINCWISEWGVDNNNIMNDVNENNENCNGSSSTSDENHTNKSTGHYVCSLALTSAICGWYSVFNVSYQRSSILDAMVITHQK